MNVKAFDSREEWLEARRGKITGSRLKDIVVKRGPGEKIGFYELIAERIAENADGENPLDRGTRLEEEAMAAFAKKTKKKLDTSLVIWERDDNPSIAISPDASVVGEKAAVEGKCLSSARHIEAYLTKKVPDEYDYQVDQYFIVNEELDTLYFVFYDPRMPAKLQMFYLTITREERKDDIQYLHEYQVEKMALVNQIVTELTF